MVYKKKNWNLYWLIIKFIIEFFIIKITIFNKTYDITIKELFLWNNKLSNSAAEILKIKKIYLILIILLTILII